MYITISCLKKKKEKKNRITARRQFITLKVLLSGDISELVGVGGRRDYCRLKVSGSEYYCSQVSWTGYDRGVVLLLASFALQAPFLQKYTVHAAMVMLLDVTDQAATVDRNHPEISRCQWPP